MLWILHARNLVKITLCMHTSGIVHEVSKWKFICQDIKYEMSVTSLDASFVLLNWLYKQKHCFQFLALDTICHAAEDLGIWYAMFWTVTSTEIFYFFQGTKSKGRKRSLSILVSQTEKAQELNSAQLIR